jgi:hypothetical protein
METISLVYPEVKNYVAGRFVAAAGKSHGRPHAFGWFGIINGIHVITR